MTTLVRSRWSVHADQVMGVMAVGLLGCGALLALQGVFAGQIAVTLVGGALGGIGLMVLLTAGWIDPLGVLVLSLPLPALLESETLRVPVAAPVTAAVLLSWALSAGVVRRDIMRVRGPWRSTLVLILIFVVATLLSPTPLDAARETLNVVVVLALALVATDILSRRSEAGSQISRIIVFVAAVNGVLAVLVAAGVLPGAFPLWGTSLRRAALGFAQPNGLGLFMAICLPLAVGEVWRAKSREVRALAWLGLIAIAFGLVATFSRGNWLAFLGGSAVLLLLGEWRMFRSIWLAILTFVVVVDVVTGGVFRDTVQRTLTDWVIAQRFALMLAGVVMFLENPVLGVGPGGFAQNVQSVSAQVTQLWDLQPTPHNAFIQMAAETGLVGLVGFVVFLGAALSALTRASRARAAEPGTPVHALDLQKAAAWAFGTAVLAGFVGWPLRHGTGQLMMIVLALGLTAGLRSGEPRTGIRALAEMRAPDQSGAA
ncbi:MAG: O-antigen ligase family protein [Gemmatimonadetes bacterium]|nr:O-antigen ligase family protein [Gemmatimonadota bacterium]